MPIPFILISIHAPTRGATWEQNQPIALEIFQSTLLQEERHFVNSKTNTNRDISIHAPTRGATITDLDDGTQNNDFNPRSYKRSDDREIGIPSLPYQFQSTLLQEERHFIIRLVHTMSNFNPRSYKRSD